MAEITFSAKGFLNIYPNPANNTVIISLPQIAVNSVIAVFNGNGRRVLQKQISSGTTSQSLDIGRLTKGTYQVKLTEANGILTKPIRF